MRNFIAVLAFSSRMVSGVPAPWWIINHVHPDGELKNVGTSAVTTFSQEQMDSFGVDETGKVLDQQKFDTAISCLTSPDKEGCKETSRWNGHTAPWYIINHVHPDGEPKDMGGYKVITFTREQMEHFGIDERGNVLDQEKFDAAISCLTSPDKEGCEETGQMARRPAPWWIINHVHPDGEPKDMGGYKVITFTREQMERFGIDERGNVLDQEKFDVAISCLTSPDKEGCEETGQMVRRPAPWWIINHVHPDGELKNVGMSTVTTFSQEQMDRFGVDENGKVLDRDRFDAAISCLTSPDKEGCKETELYFV